MIAPAQQVEQAARVEVQGLLVEAGLALHRYREAIPPEVREEMAQEATLRTLARPGVDTPAAFVRTVARHLALDHLRLERLRRAAHPDELAPSRDPLAAWERVDVVTLLRVLDRAPEHYRAVLLEWVDEDRPALFNRSGHLGRPQLWADPLERDRAYKMRERALLWVRRALRLEVA